jgi:WD40 repeat protein
MRILLMFVLVLSASGLEIQENTVTIRQQLVIEPLSTDVNTHALVHWSPDDRLIAVSFSRAMVSSTELQADWEIIDVESGQTLYEVEYFYQWYADGTRFVGQVAPDSLPGILNASTGVLETVLEEAGAEFTGGMVTDSIINLDVDHTLRIYDAKTGELKLVIEQVDQLPFFSPNDTRFTVTILDTGIQIYDAATFERLDHLDGFRVGRRSEGGWSPDSSRLIVVPLESTFWKLGPRHIWTIGERLSKPIYNLTANLFWSADSSRIVAPVDYIKIRIFDAETGEVLQTIRGFDNNVLSHVVELTDCYLVLYTSDFVLTDERIHVWDVQRNEFVFEFDIGTPGFQSLRLNGNVLELAENWDLYNFDLTTGTQINHVHLDHFIMDVSPDGQWGLSDDTLYRAEGKSFVTLYIYQLDPYQQVTSIDSPTDFIYSGGWSPTGRYIITLGQNGVIVWEFEP